MVVAVTKVASKADKPVGGGGGGAKGKGKAAEKPDKPVRGVGKKESKGALKKAVNKPPQSKSQATLKSIFASKPAKEKEEGLDEEEEGGVAGEGPGDDEEEEEEPVVAKTSRSKLKVCWVVIIRLSC